MAEKSRSAVTDYLIYLVVRLVVCVLQALSLSAACAFARFLAWLAYHVDKRHRQVAKENLAFAFPGRYDAAEMDRVVRGVYRHFCMVLIEIARMPRAVHPHNWRKHCHMVNGPRLVEAILSGRPLLIVTGHFGNWEVAGYMLCLSGFRTHAVARTRAIPYLDQYVLRLRQRTGRVLVDQHADHRNA